MHKLKQKTAYLFGYYIKKCDLTGDQYDALKEEEQMVDT